MKKIDMKIKLLNKDCMPFKKHESDSGLDLKARIDKRISIPQHSVVKIPTGICIELPEGYEARVQHRSSMSASGILCQGLIDNAYRGEIIAILHNTTDQPFLVNPYDRIAQLTLHEIIYPNITFTTELSDTERGNGGLGSTGRS
jgi:dUTP pyrophosphatase